MEGSFRGMVRRNPGREEEFELAAPAAAAAGESTVGTGKLPPPGVRSETEMGRESMGLSGILSRVALRGTGLRAVKALALEAKAPEEAAVAVV